MDKRIDIVVLLAAAALLMGLAGGCNPDRFNDVGCTADSECRLGRVCSQGVCMDPGAVDHHVEPDAGPDADTSQYADNFVGQWDMLASGRIDQSNGDVQRLEGERTPLTITEATDSGADLLVQIGDQQGICPFKAVVTSQRSFELLDEPCEFAANNSTQRFSDVAGEGTRGPDDSLVMTFQAHVEISGQDVPEMSADMDVTMEGNRR